ncbi:MULTISPECIES: hypothetical protein [unclassified Streptomyces]|uniref:hypothetical protein n=1 Tax=unclassified Streptomyces TaxID=2593676 RepID=UPI00093A4048|nr:hypothetical protein [Streptomyces sp. CB02400]
MINRAVLAHRLLTGISRQHLACLVEGLTASWQANPEGRRHAARGGVRKRAAGAGARHQLVFVDRLVATLIHLRHNLPHALGRPRKPRPGALPDRVEEWERDRHWYSSDRVTVEHTLADHKRWKQPTRWTHRRDRLPDTYRAIASLVSDRTMTA